MLLFGFRVSTVKNLMELFSFFGSCNLATLWEKAAHDKQA